MKIAICDDDVADLKLMQSYCGRYDSTIPTTAFTSGEALLEAYCKDFYDLVFLDIEMGQLNGLELGARLIHLSPKPVIVRAFSFCRQRARAREVRRSPRYRGQCLPSSRQDSLGKQKSSFPAPNQLPILTPGPKQELPGIRRIPSSSSSFRLKMWPCGPAPEDMRLPGRCPHAIPQASSGNHPVSPT